MLRVLFVQSGPIDRTMQASHPPLPVAPHDRFSKRVRLSTDEVSAQARSLGDNNPIHHDPIFARQHGFNGLVASGGHTSALLLGLAASHFQQFGLMLGLEFSMRFVRPVYAEQRLMLEWLVIRMMRRRRTGGYVADLRGRIRSDEGTTRLGSAGRVLVIPS